MIPHKGRLNAVPPYFITSFYLCLNLALAKRKRQLLTALSSDSHQLGLARETPQDPLSLDSILAQKQIPV